MGCAGAITLDKQEDGNRAPQKGRGSGRASERGPPGPRTARTVGARLRAAGKDRGRGPHSAPAAGAGTAQGSLLPSCASRRCAPAHARPRDHARVAGRAPPGCSSPSTPGGRSGDKAGRGAGRAAHQGLGRVRGRPPSLLGLAGGCAAPAHRDADHRRQGGTKEATAAHGSSTACQAARPEAEGGGAVRGLRPGPGVGGGGGGSEEGAPRGGAGRGSPGSWGRSGCRRRCTPRGSSPPRSPGRRPGWRRPSLKNRGETFRAGAAGLAGPHPCPAPEAPATPPSSHH